MHTQWIYRYIQCVFWAERRLFNYFSLSLVKTVTYSCTGCMRKWGQAVHSGSCVLRADDRTFSYISAFAHGCCSVRVPTVVLCDETLILVMVQVS